MKPSLPLTPRQRTLATANRKCPPVMASDIKTTPEVEQELLTYLKLGQTDEIIDALGVCCLHWPWRHILPRGLDRATKRDGIEFDIWGVGRKEISYGAGTYLEITHSPLADAASVADVERYPWPKMEDLDFGRIVEDVKANERFALSISQFHLFEPSWHMRGLENFLMDVASDDPIAEAIINRVEQFHLACVHKILELAPGQIHFIGWGDDFGTQSSMFFSLDTWKRIFGPRYRRLYAMAHKQGLKTWMHSDGALRPLLPTLIDTGLDILHPLMATIPDMDPYSIIAEFGKHLCFDGTIDVQRLLPFGTEQEVRDEVRKQLDQLWSRGGVFMGTSHCIQPGTPMRNILAVYEELSRAL
jgi:uroporphyrinogen decarboxylase